MKKAFAPTLVLGVAAAALTAGASSAQAVGFRSCDAVRAAGLHTPIPFGDPNYQANLDRDNDGWACEPPGVNLPDPRKATKPAPTKPAPTMPSAPAPSKTTPATPAKPIPAKPAPAQPTKPAPVVTPAPAQPSKPAPVVQAPATSAPAQPTKPAQPLPAKPGMGPKVDTDLVASQDSSATGAAAIGLFAVAAGAGAWRARTARKG